MKRLNLTDKKFGRLYVKEFAYIKKERSYWKCVCDCGVVKIICGGKLKNKYTKSCGCLITETNKEYGRSHRGKKSPNFGRCCPEETKRKISKAQKNKKKHSEEAKLKMSKDRKGKNIGKDNPNWNPNLTDKDRIGRRHIPGYEEWVQEVYKLDDYTCRKCEQRGKYLNAHHIESYNNNPELRTEVSNGITFCKGCHKDFHHQYGYGDNTRAQLIMFLNKEAIV